jgi:hypothetical protein
MGAGSSLNLPSRLTKDQVRILLGDAYDEALFDSHADSDGLLNRDQFFRINEIEIFM